VSDPITVPLIDLRAQHATIRDEIAAAMQEVVETQYFILGPTVQRLERAIAEYCQAAHAVGCASGSDALLLSLMAFDIGPGDQVICPAHTFFATGGSIARLGAEPVFADIDPTTYNVDPDHVAAVAQRCKRLRAIMPVHLYGQSVDMDALLEIARRHDVPLIEDAAQAIGTRDDRGAPSGSRGVAGCFSFFPTKNLGGFGDGGIVTTNDAGIDERLRMLRNHGGHDKYTNPLLGMNSRLDALQAAVLEVKLRHLERWHEGRRANAAHYDRAFAGRGAADSSVPLSQGSLPLRTPKPPAEPARHIYNQYVIRVPAEHRDALRDHLRQQGVGSEIYYPTPLHLQECFERLGYKPGDLPHTEAAARETIALPVYPELTQQQREHVVNTIATYLETAATPTAATAR
jgi:dTDP-4-amino-4,6-dideoxygalactose transaminase